MAKTSRFMGPLQAWPTFLAFILAAPSRSAANRKAYYHLSKVAVPPESFYVLGVLADPEPSGSVRLVCEGFKLEPSRELSMVTRAVVSSWNCSMNSLESRDHVVFELPVDRWPTELNVGCNFLDTSTGRAYRLYHKPCLSSQNRDPASHRKSPESVPKMPFRALDRGQQQAISSSFLTMTSRLEARLRAKQMITLADAASNTIPGIMIQVLADDMIPDLIKGLQGDLTDTFTTKWDISKDSGQITKLTFKYLDDMLSNYLLTDAATHTFEQSHMKLEEPLRKKINETITETIIKCLGAPVTRKASNAILSASTTLVRAHLHRGVALATIGPLTRAISRSVSHVLTRTLSRKPIADYHCFYCRKKSLYCGECAKSLEAESHRDYYANHYSAYYSDYYGRAYADSFAIQNPINAEIKRATAG